MRPIRVILAEDHSLVREGTRRILEQHPDLLVVGDAADGEQALEILERLQPDVAILDIRLPKLNGIEIVRRMKQCAPNTKALMLTAYDDDDYIFSLMEAGASGYLLKTARAAELVEAVRDVYEGESVLAPAIAAKIARLWRQRETAKEEGTSEKLSPREREVLVLAAKGLRNKAIAQKLGISVRTIEGHFNSILAKLGVSSRTEAALYAISHRWVSLEEGDPASL